MSRQTRDQIAHYAARPGGRSKLHDLQDRFEKDRARCVRLLEDGKARMAALQSAIDEQDIALAQIAAAIKEVRA